MLSQQSFIHEKIGKHLNIWHKYAVHSQIPHQITEYLFLHLKYVQISNEQIDTTCVLNCYSVEIHINDTDQELLKTLVCNPPFGIITLTQLDHIRYKLQWKYIINDKFAQILTLSGKITLCILCIAHINNEYSVKINDNWYKVNDHVTSKIRITSIDTSYIELKVSYPDKVVIEKLTINQFFDYSI